jgi:RNA polymerase sigma-70 factor, ECF subfamily
MSSSSFGDLLAAAQARDEHAFTVLFRSVQPGLLRYLRTVGGALADDVAAETWVSVVRGLDRFRGDENGFRAWVFTIARARLVDAQRAMARTPVPVDTELSLAGRPDSVDVVGRVEEIFSTEAALALIGQLPKDQAEAVLLRHVVGLDVSHAAAVLGKRAGAVRVACHRGLRRLGQLMEARTTEAAVHGVTQTSRFSVGGMTGDERARNARGEGG